MSSNSRFAVAVHTVTLLALSDGPVSSSAIAGSVSTNPVVIRRILGALHQAGLVHTQLGPEGGAVLAQRPEDITLLDVYRATGQSDLFALPAHQPNPLCPCGRNIQPVLIPVLEQAEDAVQTTLAAVTVADLVDQIRQREHVS